MKLLEDAMERLNATDPNIQRQLKGETTWCIYKLAQMYFDAAVQNHRSKTPSSRAFLLILICAPI